MKLYLTATSERGKPVYKSGNDVIRITVTKEQRQKFDIMFDGDKLEILKYSDGKIYTVEYMTDTNMCPKHKAQILPDENGDCSLCGQRHEGMI